MVDDGAKGLEKTNIHAANKIQLLPLVPSNATVVLGLMRGSAISREVRHRARL